jgi:hypothetical protein
LTVTASLVSTSLPFLAGASSEDVVAIRGKEDAFDDWRRQFRTIVRQIESSPTAQGFSDEASEAISDVLLPAAREVEAAVGRSTALTKASKEATIGLVIGGAAVAATAVAGLPIAGAAIGTSVSTIGRWVYNTTFGTPKPAGANAVLARLIAARPPHG